VKKKDQQAQLYLLQRYYYCMGKVHLDGGKEQDGRRSFSSSLLFIFCLSLGRDICLWCFQSSNEFFLFDVLF
jgi:hypothetical protein